jgi:flavin reductase (DIM6/NTAB) family NADH-FMN oxidoreductase RutF
MAALTEAVGTDSAHTHPDKLQRHAVALFDMPESSGIAADNAPPLVQGCAAWLLCRVIPEPHNQQTYDLFIGEVVAAWADDRVFRNGHWEFDSAPDSLRTLHYVAGGQFYATGASVKV